MVVTGPRVGRVGRRVGLLEVSLYLTAAVSAVSVALSSAPAAEREEVDELLSGRVPKPAPGGEMRRSEGAKQTLVRYNGRMTNIDDEVLELPLEAGGWRPAGAHPAYALAAEVRAVEEGHLARVLPDGSVLVKSDSGAGSYRVGVRAVDGGVVRLGCSCPSGVYRGHLPVPCKHAALAGRRLEREGLARWRDGVWHLRERAALRAALASAIRPRARRGAAHRPAA
jgi:hypothetical protein